MLRIFLVEDDEAIARNLIRLLRAEGFSVTHALTRGKAHETLAGDRFDLALVDISLPDGNGFAVCTEIKENGDIPVIFLTASDDEASVVTGFHMGADDYVTKPFSPSELMARVDALYRRVLALRSREEVSYLEEITSGDFVLNLRSRTLLKHGQPIELTQVEFQIMEYFFTNPGKALSRTSILTRVWGEEYFGEEKIVDVNIRRLRMKIEEDPSSPQYILTVWGMGYKWSVPD